MSLTLVVIWLLSFKEAEVLVLSLYKKKGVPAAPFSFFNKNVIVISFSSLHSDYSLVSNLLQLPYRVNCNSILRTIFNRQPCKHMSQK